MIYSTWDTYHNQIEGCFVSKFLKIIFVDITTTIDPNCSTVRLTNYHEIVVVLVVPWSLYFPYW